jgi:hypothetical protein
MRKLAVVEFITLSRTGHQPDDNPPRRQSADSRLTTYLANAARCENDSPTSSAARRSGAHRPVKRLEGKVAVVTGPGVGSARPPHG